MSVDAKARSGAVRATALGSLGLVIGPVAWFIVLYGTGLVVSPWKESKLGWAQAVFVFVEIAALVGLAVASIRVRQARALVVGILLSFTTVSLLYWRSLW